MTDNRESGSGTQQETLEVWPARDLESVSRCPYCDGEERSLRFTDVEDWTFRCAPGRWTYWQCASCAALYLDPRPSRSSIGRAYAGYYTHSSRLSWIEQAKTMARQACYHAWHGIALRPRLPIPSFMVPLLDQLRPFVADPPLPLRALNRLPRGRLIDVGCGNGHNLLFAQQLGWDCVGLEIDARAAATARASGVRVDQGGFERLSEFQNVFDCVVCSHVIEHVHDPLELLSMIVDALKPGGTALISLPNAGSAVLDAVGVNWRGLEAPRHLAIPAFEGFVELLHRHGLEIYATENSRAVTLPQSLKIAELRGESKHSIEIMKARGWAKGEIGIEASDFISLELRKH